MPRSKSRARFRTVAELLDALGGIPPWRVSLDPPPGSATKRKLVSFRSPSGGTVELIDGTFVEKPRDSLKAYLVAECSRLISNHVHATEAGIVYGPGAWTSLGHGVVRAPDISFVSWSKRPERTVPREQVSEQIPNLVVEVLSPSNTRGEMARKLKEYFLAGVVVAWVIDPVTRSAAIYTAPNKRASFDENGVLDGGDVLPGFRLPLAKLFARLEPQARKRKK